MSTTTKERPIILRDTEIHALLADGAVEVRRVVKPQPERPPYPCHYVDSGWALEGLPNEHGVKGCSCREVKCPFGAPGAVLVVKETWSTDHAAFYPHFPIVYAADRGVDYVENGQVFSPEANAWYPFRWRSPACMPLAYVRLTVSLAAVRVERTDGVWSWVASFRRLDTPERSPA